ncbi:glycosyl hydrolase family 28-related protein [Porifericola rhodea]|uniref:glycosyl hydrolase family 28-related protein n=1 Tax=Porifericola rhodea TaxID=930972 RepID=UPI0026669338|nr:glycosyl hydrolase family 28-related protein [Porifericola rhodea]WKN33473.1 glycosyl hydrolase family 28-related protein [Porifericola rhodea]
MLEGWYNVKDFGAKGNGEHDDTQGIVNTIEEAKKKSSITGSNFRSQGVVYFPPGVYRVSAPIIVTNHEYYGCRIEGANAESVKIVPKSNLSNLNKVFVFMGGSGAFSNVGIKNMTISCENQYYNAPGNCVGIYIDGQCFANFENIRFKKLKYGVWLHNESARAYSELNQFHQIEFSFCENGIRIEQGKGSHSFHGNDFNNCYFNVGAKQIGFNHTSGFFYNARFRLFFWGHTTESTYINANGNAIDNIGDITYESFKPGKITGKGRFWFNGFIRGRGTPNNGLVDKTVPPRPWEKVFACDNYWKKEKYADSEMSAGPINSPNSSFNGPFGFFQSLTKKNVESVVLNTYAGSSENGLYLGRSRFKQEVNQANLGLFLSGQGDKIQSYHRDYLNIESNKGLSITAGSTTGFKITSGFIRTSGGSKNTYEWKDIMKFNTFIGGRLFAVDEKASESTCLIANIMWNKKEKSIDILNESIKRDKKRLEHISIQFKSKEDNILQLGTNYSEETTVKWFFDGVVW